MEIVKIEVLMNLIQLDGNIEFKIFQVILTNQLLLNQFQKFNSVMLADVKTSLGKECP